MFEPFTQNDEIQLLAEAEKAKSPWLLGTLLLTFINIFSCGKKFNKPSLVDQYGFFTPFVLSFLGFGIIFFIIDTFKNTQYTRDLKQQQKKLATVKVMNKSRSFELKTYSLELDSDVEKFRYLPITESQYQTIQKGDMVTLVYAPNSKFLFELRKC